MSNLPARSNDSPLGIVEVIDPFSGQLINVSDPATAAEFVYALRTSKNVIDKLIKQVTTAAEPAFRQAGTKTLRFGAIEMELKEPVSYDWDEEILHELVDAGLPEERYADLVKETVVRKVNQSVAKQLEASNEKYREIIERARTRVEKPPTLDVRPVKEVAA
jgi:hypothetical protein